MNRQFSPLPSPSSRRSSDGAHCLLLMLPQAAYIVAQKPIQSITALVKDPLRFSNKNVNIKIGFNQMSLKEKEVSQTRE
ncbi:hypothetical protein YC2023_105233 [Brassica napus]